MKSVLFIAVLSAGIISSASAKDLANYDELCVGKDYDQQACFAVNSQDGSIIISAETDAIFQGLKPALEQNTVVEIYSEETYNDITESSEKHFFRISSDEVFGFQTYIIKEIAEEALKKAVEELAKKAYDEFWKEANRPKTPEETRRRECHNECHGNSPRVERRVETSGGGSRPDLSELNSPVY